MPLSVPKLPLSLGKKTQPTTNFSIPCYPSFHSQHRDSLFVDFVAQVTFDQDQFHDPCDNESTPNTVDSTKKWAAAEAIPDTTLSSARLFISRSRQLPWHGWGNRARGDQATEVGANGSAWAEGISTLHWHQKCTSAGAFSVAFPRSAEQKEQIEAVLWKLTCFPTLSIP